MNAQIQCAPFLRSRARCGALWLATAVFLMVLSQSALTTAYPQGIRLSGRYDGEGLPFTEIRRVRDQAADERGEPLAQIAGWRQKEAELTAKPTGGTLAVDALCVDGSLEAVWSLKPVSGSLPIFGAEHITALSRGAALKLFGSTDILGQTVKCEGEALVVVCVFELPKGASAPAADPGRELAILPASSLKEDEKKEAPTAEGIDILFQDGFNDEPGAAAEGWFSKAGATMPDRMENNAQTKALFTFAASLPRLLMALVLSLILAGESVRRARAASARFAAHREDPLTGSGRRMGTLFKGISGAAIFALLALGILLISGTGARLPPAYIPSRWSDLSFWPNLLRGLLSDAAHRALLGAARRELIAENLSALSCFLAILALPAVWFSFRAFRQSACLADGALAAGAGWWVPAAIFFSPAAAFLARRIGLTPFAGGADLWLPALFTVVCSIHFPKLECTLRAVGRTLTPRRKAIKQEEST